MLFFIDFKKAFDSLEWKFLFKILEAAMHQVFFVLAIKVLSQAIRRDENLPGLQINDAE